MAILKIVDTANFIGLPVPPGLGSPNRDPSAAPGALHVHATSRLFEGQMTSGSKSAVYCGMDIVLPVYNWDNPAADYGFTLGYGPSAAVA
jgi:hypothetical protein